ncbi:MAG: hypothetical protein U1A77_05790 [Pirellulales bacterium]
MRWLRKLLSVGMVIGVAALMSIPFKRVPPRETNKSAGRGQWEFVEPRLQFEQILKPTAGVSADAATSVSDDVQRPVDSSGLIPNSTPSRVQRDGASNGASSTPSPATDSSASESMTRGSTGRTRSAARPIPTDDAPPIRDHEAYPMSPMSRLPRIETEPPRSERIGESGIPPALPDEFKPLAESSL